MRTTKQKHKARAKTEERRSVRRATKMPGLESKVVDLVSRLQDAMAEAVDNEIPPEDAPVYLAGKRDVYAGHVLIVLEDLGVKIKIPEERTT